MTTILDRRRQAPSPRRGPGVVHRLVSTDHKNIGILYCVSAFAFFLVGGSLAEVMRLELMEPSRQIVSNEAYNTLFTIHGTVMIFLFVAPFATGLANYLIPLQVGVNEAGTALSTGLLGLGAASGLTLGIVRKAREVCWTVVGFTLLIRHGLTARAVLADRELTAPRG